MNKVNLEEYFKTILEVLHLSISRRISLAISFGIFLGIKLLFDIAQKKDFFNWLTVLLTILIFLMLATAMADIYDKHQANIRHQKELEDKRA